MYHHDPPPAYDMLGPMDSNSNRPYHIQHPQQQSPRSYDGHFEPQIMNDTDNAVLNQALDFAHQIPTPSLQKQTPPLQRLIAIPQIIAGPGKPFCRAHAPILTTIHSIPQSALLSFIDNLNIISSGTPPLRILDMTSGLIGMVPWHYAQLLSLGIGAAAKVGNRVVASVRGDRFMERANAEFFAPRGLKVELVTSPALAELVGVSLEDIARRKMEELTRQGGEVIGARALVARFGDHIERLNWDVPPPEKADNVLDQLSARVQANQLKKAEKKSRKDAEKKDDSSDSESSTGQKDGKISRKLKEIMLKKVEVEEKRDEDLAKVKSKHSDGSKRSKEEAKVWKDFEDEMEKLDEKYRKEASKGSKQKEIHGKSSSKGSKKEREEVKALSKLQWILIGNLRPDPTA